MSGAIPPFPQYALMAWCSVKTQGQLLPNLNNCSTVLSFYVIDYYRRKTDASATLIAPFAQYKLQANIEAGR
jgi:hypothetical protein